MQHALRLADTGHLVIAANFSAQSVGDALETVLNGFGSARPVLEKQLARTLVAVFNQRLLPRADKPGRVAAYEILLGDAPGVRDALQNGMGDWETLMEADANCQTRRGAVAALRDGGIISEETAQTALMDLPD